MAGSDLGRRVGVAAVGIPVALSVLYFGRWPTAGVLSILAGIGAMEVYRLGREKGWKAFPVLGVTGTVALVLLAGWAGDPVEWAFPAIGIVLATTLLAMTGAVFVRGPTGDPLPAVGVTVIGPLWVGLPFAFGVFLRTYLGGEVDPMGFQGAYLLILPISVTWVGDSGAYFVGRQFGRRKLLPSVSPAKTVEGAIAGLITSMIACVAFAWIFLGPEAVVHLPLIGAALLGAALSIAAQVGDLAESVFKREAGVKDSGTLLPGHGGVLDRFDALLFTMPVAYLLLPFLLA